MTGAQIILHNANQWYTSNSEDEYVNALLKYLEYDKKGYLAEEEKSTSYIVKTNRFKENKLTIDKERNLSLYLKIMGKLSLDKYKGLSGARTILGILEQGRERFESLSCIDQAYVILHCVRFMKCNAEAADLRLIGGANGSGSIKIAKNVTEVKLKIVQESSCGLYKRLKTI